MSKQIRDLSCSVSSFKFQLDNYLSTIPVFHCVTNYDNSLENSSHANPHLLAGVGYFLFHYIAQSYGLPHLYPILWVTLPFTTSGGYLHNSPHPVNHSSNFNIIHIPSPSLSDYDVDIPRTAVVCNGGGRGAK